MSPPSSSLFIIAGPTAAGKSELAVAVAESCGGEIVSADAFQVYRGLDILTAKPSPALRTQVPHHLIGEIPLSQPFDVAQYLRLARERIADICSRGRIPIIVGGTGLYLRALTHGLAELPSANALLRTNLESQTTVELGHRLATLDPISYAQIDLQNRRRVIRALEVCLLTGGRFSSFRDQWITHTVAASGVVLSRERDELHHRIHRRTAAMFSGGVVDEVRHAGPLGPTAPQTLGWRQIQGLIEGTMTQQDCVQEIEQATRRYAKRQLTWFRRETYLTAVNLTGDDPPPALIKELAQKALRAAVDDYEFFRHLRLSQNDYHPRRSSPPTCKGGGLPRAISKNELKIMAKKTDSKSKPAAPAKKAIKPAVKKKPAAAKTKGAAKAPSPKATVPTPKAPAYTSDDVALRAYFIAEKRRSLGLPGDEHHDWVEAERQLAAENKRPKKAAKA